jgi:signal transduction histidine kinase
VVSTDPVRLRQILLNLLVNSIKFTPRGFIHFGYNMLDDNQLIFYVRDTGIGIAPEKHEEVFQYFRQLDAGQGRANSGTGLGLAISRNLVTLLGGKIWLESEEGKGATFFFTLPFKVVNF